jgi:hypothetical protein
VTATAALVLALALPQHGVLAPGRSLGGVRLGDTAAAVAKRWGPRFGTCRGCPEPTRYFTYKQFEPQGAGAVFRRGRAVALFTLWSPPGWRTTKGLVVGDGEARVTEVYGALQRTTCIGYDALTLRSRGTITAIYLTDEIVYGFGLLRAFEPVCR